MSGSRRAGSSKAAKALAATAKLRELREGGGKRSRIDEVDAEADAIEDVYEELDEEQYRALVAKRREEGAGFVVNDDGEGYEDLGEEEDWTAANENYSDDEEYDADGRKAQKAAPEPKKKLSAKEKAKKANANAKSKAGMLVGGVPKKKKLDDLAAEADTDAMLEDILAGVDMDVGSTAPMVVSAPKPKTKPYVPPVAPRRSPRKAVAASTAATIARSPAKTPGSSAKKSVRFEIEEEDEDLPTGDVGAFDDEDDGAIENDDVDIDVAMPEAEPLSAETKKSVKIVKTDAGQRPPEPESILKTLDEDEEPEDVGPVTQDAGPVTFNGAELPRDSDGSTPFFFMDAQEERESPGTVFLFGRVPVSSDPQSETISACAVVQNMQRCMYIVPTASTFADPDGELEALGQMMEETRREFKSCADSDDKKEEKRIAAQKAISDLMKKLVPLSGDLRAEVKEVLKARKIENSKITIVRRRYCFERKDIPQGPLFVLKVKIPATYAAFPSDIKGKHFVAALGTQAPMLELLTLKSKLKGPSWIALHGAAIVPTEKQKSWCKLELTLPNAHKSVRPCLEAIASRPAPRLTVASLNLQTIVNQQTNVNEIAVASVQYIRDVNCEGSTTAAQLKTGLRHFTVVRKLDGLEMPPGWQNAVAHENNTNVIAKRTGSVVLAAQNNELGLLNFLLAKLHQLDPDVIVGHNIGGFNLDVLLRRFQANKIGHWSRIGRMKRTRMPNINGSGGAYGGGASMGALQCLAGRLLADTYLSAKDLLGKEVSYTLTSLSETQLGVRREEVPSAEIPNRYQDTNALMHLIKCTEIDAKLSLHLMFKMEVVPLTKQLSNIAGNLWSKTLGHTRAQRVEYLLLHEFHSRKHIVPDRLSAKERRRVAAASGEEEDDGGKKGPSYAGGLVLEPKKGLYDTFVLVLDYQSLYPSIIQEYNICYTTVRRHFDAGEENTEIELPAPILSDKDFAVLPKVIANIVQSRREVKGLMAREKDPARAKQYDLRQLALKLTANSMYGCLGFSQSRFFAEPIAALITAQGRKILQRTVDLAKAKCELDVIYGDTDSIMVNTKSHDLNHSRALGNKLIRFVNKEYRKLVLEEDYIFRSMLLLKKKKYAAMKVVNGPNGTKATKLEMKGLDIVRRDWAPLVKDLGKQTLEELLDVDGEREERVNAIHDGLRTIRKDMVENRVQLSKYIITKQLTKAVEEYPDAKHQPHVMVAKRRLEAGKQDGVKAGETVPYIIALESELPLEDIAAGKAGASGGKGLAERAYHPDEILEKGLKVDLHYYLSQQVHPVITRLCAPIEETDGAAMAECLGLDSNKFKTQTRDEDEYDDTFGGGRFALDDEERFAKCKPLKLRTRTGVEFDFRGIREVMDDKMSATEVLAPPTPGAGKENAPAQGKTALRTETIDAASLANQVSLAVRERIKEFYAAPLRSDDDVDATETRNIALRCHHTNAELTGTLSADPMSKGTMEKSIPEDELYNQLLYYKRLLSIKEAERSNKSKDERAEFRKKISEAPGLEIALDGAHEKLEKIMNKSSYMWISLADLFSVAKA